jgi:hypothetical protein
MLFAHFQKGGGREGSVEECVRGVSSVKSIVNTFSIGVEKVGGR